MGLITLIINALTGGVARELAEAFKARQVAQTDAARIAADERIAKLQNIRDIQVAEAGSPINAIIRACIGIPPAIYLGKLYLWDKVLGWGVTDDLSPQLWQVAWIVIGFYFAHETAIGVARIARKK